VSSLSSAAILIVDEREIEARGVKSALLSRGCLSVHYCFSQAEAHAALVRQRCDLVLIHQGFNNGKGVIVASQLKAISHSDSAIVILAQSATWQLAQEVQASGAHALLSTSLPFETLLDALEALLRNSSRFIFIGERGASSLIEELTFSERAILEKLAEGLTTREIAEARHNSEATIKSHLTAIYRKLGARNRVEAIAHLKKS
jgi:DNA-binding NarL/FixJ family response regulator